MTTQESGLDELRAEYEKFLRTWFSTAAILRTEPPGMRDHQKEADRRFAALVTAIEAPWREALRGAEWEGESWGDPACPLCGGLMPLLHESDPPHQPRLVSKFGIGHREWCEIRALLNRDQEAEVNDD